MTASVLPNEVPPGLIVPPRFATPRDPGRRSYGPAVGRVMRAIGQPPMPWQQYVADVAGEVDQWGRYVYPLVIVSVPRQAGKTSIGLGQAVHRCLQGPNRRAWWTAQTGQDARDKFRELVATIMASPLREVVAGRPRLQNGAECLTFVNGSTLRPHPPTRDALHGKQSDHNDVDEGWSFTEEQGADLFQAITPTQATRPGAQTFVWSTRGDAGSTWFHNLIERGYARVPGVAVFDWGIPADADPMDVATVAAHHPAVGHTITIDTLRAAQATLGDKPGEYARAYGNRETGAAEQIIPAEAWAAVQTTADLTADRPAYGVGVFEDGDGVWGALVAAVRGLDGLPEVEVIERRPGRAWLVDRIRELNDPGKGVACDRRGPAAPVAARLELAGVTLLENNYPAACQDFYDRIVPPDDPDAFWEPGVRIRTHPALDAAVEVAGRKTIGDGAWLFSRTRSGGDISTLEGAAQAVWALDRAPEPFVAVADFG